MEPSIVLTMETDAGFRGQPEFQTYQQSIRLNTDQRKHYKYYTGTYANEYYKCLKLLPEREKKTPVGITVLSTNSMTSQ
jgi:hypothetical protein